MRPSIMQRFARFVFELGIVELDRAPYDACMVMLNEVGSPKLGQRLVDLSVALRPEHRFLADEASALAQEVCS
jgi:hypothetical protein